MPAKFDDLPSRIQGGRSPSARWIHPVRAFRLLPVPIRRADDGEADELGGLFPAPDPQVRPDLCHQPIGDHGRYRHHDFRSAGQHMQQEQNPTMRKVLSELKRSVEAGDDFSSALSQHPKCSTKPTFRSSEPAKRPVSWGKCSIALPITYAKRWKRGESTSRDGLPGCHDVRRHGRDDLPTHVHPAEIHATVSKPWEKPARPHAVHDATSAVLTQYWYAWLAAAVDAVGRIHLWQTHGNGTASVGLDQN